MAWDPATYLAFEAERTRPAADLLAHVAAGDPAFVVDLGCGTGNSTALLARRWPRARLQGVDSSAEMLAKAETNPFPAQWRQADIAGWSPDHTPDVIFANASLQWLPAHDKLLPRLVSFLGSGGVFAFQVPRNFSDPSHTALQALAREPRWKDNFLRPVERPDIPEPAACHAILEPHVARLDIWETRYLQILEGEDAVFRWTSGTALRPYLQALEGAARDGFEAEYRARMAEAYPRQPSGKTLFPFRRLFVVAVR